MKGKAVLPPVPRRLRSRSKYEPHQSVGEQMRRVGQILRGQLQSEDLPSPETVAKYVDYTTAKAAGQDLTRFKGRVLPVQDVSAGVLNPGDDYDGLMDVQVLPEEG